MEERSPEEFVTLIEERIAKKQYDELFSGGCCFHFALRCFRRGLGSLNYTQSASNPKKKGHVFVITKDGLAFDHKGYREISAIKEAFCNWKDEPHFPTTESEIEGAIANQGLPESLTSKVLAIADEIIADRLGRPCS